VKVVQFPLVRITLFFISGILFAQHIKPNFNWILLALLVGFLLVFLSFLFFLKRLKKPFLFGVFAVLLSFFIGVFAFVSSNPIHNHEHYFHQLNKVNDYNSFEITIKEKLKTTAYFERYVAQVNQINEIKSKGKIVVNIKKDSSSHLIPIGTRISLNGTLHKNKKPNNPNQFDYGRYLENQHIYGQIYSDYTTLKTSTLPEKSVSYYASKLRNRIIHNLEKNNFSKTELHVVVALILGQQQDISPDVIRDYQYAGAIHILSVSGLHVGLILVFVTFLLRPIPNTKKNALLKLSLVLLSLWGFGILAGLAPSVVRSVTMFSFVAVGMFLRRSVNIYHTLLVSAMLILLVRPSFLFDVGFQLSYIALFFIVWLQPLLTSIWTPKNKIVNYFWEIITVSFAAQLGTFPLSIYYFHQFPGLFFITNLIVIPMLSLILATGVVVMFFAAFDWVWMPMLQFLEWSIYWLNTIISWVASFENFILKDISFSWSLMIASYLLLFSCIIWLKQPNFKKLLYTFTAIIVVQLTVFQNKYESQKQQEFIVFHQEKKTLLTERNGTKLTVYTNEKTIDIPVLKSYVVANSCHISSMKSLSNLYYFKNTKMLLLDSLGGYTTNDKPDILLLTHSPKINLDRLFIQWKPKQVVVDGSNFKSYVTRWKTTCDKEKIPFHDTSEKGFYKL
jgi:competence protein ComEC